MAATMTCDICNNVPADFAITMIANGDTIAIGTECVLTWAKAIDKALKALAKAEQTASTDAPKNPNGAELGWEDGYPQGRPTAAQEPPGAPETAEPDTGQPEPPEAPEGDPDPPEPVGPDTQETTPTGHRG